MIGTEIHITNTLAVEVGRLAASNPSSHCHIAYDDELAQEEWLVAFPDGDYPVTFIVNDETGEYSLRQHRWYTVIGLYEDNMQRFATSVLALTPQDAERRIHAEADANDHPLIIAGVVAGDHTVVA